MKLRNIGLPSMLLVLIVLALTMFSVLSLAEAQRGRELAGRYAAAAAAYYQADTEAEVWRADLIQRGTAANAAANFTIDEGRTLHVELDGDGKTVVWRVLITSDAAVDNSLPVWEGNDE